MRYILRVLRTLIKLIYWQVCTQRSSVITRKIYRCCDIDRAQTTGLAIAARKTLVKRIRRPFDIPHTHTLTHLRHYHHHHLMNVRRTIALNKNIYKYIVSLLLRTPFQSHFDCYLQIVMTFATHSSTWWSIRGDRGCVRRLEDRITWHTAHISRAGTTPTNL